MINKHNKPRFTARIPHHTVNQIIDKTMHDNGYTSIEHMLQNSISMPAGDALHADIVTKHLRAITNTRTKPVDPDHPMAQYLGNVTIGHVSAYGLLVGYNPFAPLYYAILYIDNRQRCRFYIPTEGNAFNPITSQPFGMDPLSDDIVANHIGFTDYADIDMRNMNDMALFYNTDMIVNDITTTIAHI